ncbi:MAG TPA: MBL fold metallo-hydrolase [Candidatus Nanopelagicaceae bacterium]|nr:MBL fold metallo-hydrolase [Candidatus Nanopelagicaceae bacterium]
MDDFIQPLNEDFSEIFFIQGKNRAKYPYSNSLLIGDHLIDTGVSPQHLRKLKKFYPINHVLLSHWHEDHISGNFLLENAKFYCHLKDKIPIEDIQKMIPLYNVRNTPIEEELRKLIEILKIQNIKIDTLINEGDIFNIGEDLRLKVLFTPGHTAGHCAFYELKTKIAFLGDIDLSKYPYYGNTDANLEDFENSIARIKNLDLNIVATGHRGVIEGGKKILEEFEKYESIIQERDERILSYFSERERPVNLNDLKNKNIIYRKYTAFKDFEVIAELLMIKKHFEKFQNTDIISEEKNGYLLL